MPKSIVSRMKFEPPLLRVLCVPEGSDRDGCGLQSAATELSDASPHVDRHTEARSAVGSTRGLALRVLD